MASSGAARGVGATVRIGVGETPTWTTLVGIESFDHPDQTPPEIDATHLASPDDTEESIRGMKPVAGWSVDLHHVPGGATHTLLIGLEDTGESVQLELVDKTGATAVTYGGYVKSYVPKGIGPKDKMMATLNMAIQARITAE
jgi:hypothetical protein